MAKSPFYGVSFFIPLLDVRQPGALNERECLFWRTVRYFQKRPSLDAFAC